MTIDSSHRHSSDCTDPNYDLVGVQCGMPQSQTGSMGLHCSRVEFVTTAVVDHHSTNLTDGQAHCFPNALLRDRECSSAASASEEKVEQIDLRLLTNQEVRAFVQSAPALPSDDLARVFDSTNRALASDHQARAFDSTILVVVEDPFQSDMPQHCGVVTLREHVETVAPLPTVDVMSVTVVRNDGRKTVSEQGVQRITSKSKEETAQT